MRAEGETQDPLGGLELSWLGRCTGTVMGTAQHRSSQCTVQMCSFHHAVGGASAMRSGHRRRDTCRNWHHSTSKCGMEGCSWGGFGSASWALAAPQSPLPLPWQHFSGDRAHPASQQDHPLHARLCDSPPLQPSPQLFIFTALSCVHEPHRETHTAAPVCSHPCVCMHKHAHKHTRAHVCTQTCTKILPEPHMCPQAGTHRCAQKHLHTPTCAHTN